MRNPLELFSFEPDLPIEADLFPDLPFDFGRLRAFLTATYWIVGSTMLSTPWLMVGSGSLFEWFFDAADIGWEVAYLIELL